MSKPCDACGKPNANIGMGSAMLCRACAEEIRVEMDDLRSQGKQVNVLGIARRMYRETYSAGNYLLRDIPKSLWDRGKTYISINNPGDGKTLRDITLESLDEYLTKRGY